MCGELLMTFGPPSVCVWIRSGRPFRSVSKSSMYFSASISVTPVRLLLAYVGDRGCRIQSHKREAGGGSPRPLDETIRAADETFLAGGAVNRKRSSGTIAMGQTGGFDHVGTH